MATVHPSRMALISPEMRATKRSVSPSRLSRSPRRNHDYDERHNGRRPGRDPGYERRDYPRYGSNSGGGGVDFMERCDSHVH